MGGKFILRTVMRHIDLIVVHCSTKRSKQNFPVTALISCHAERIGFTGYHNHITHDGQTYQTHHKDCPYFDANAEYQGL